MNGLIMTAIKSNLGREAPSLRVTLMPLLVKKDSTSK